MRIIVDLDLHEAVTDFGNQSPAPTFVFKSQDTIDFQIYFVQSGIVQDMGSGFALKFGMIKVGDTTNTILAYQTVSTYLTDNQGRVYYQMQVVMNTSQMATAIGTNPSITCTIEIRYQDALAEIIHSLNIPATVFATILVETGVTPPNVSTGYPDASTIELLVHKNVASGYAGLDANSHIFPSQLGGVAELVAHKDQPSGYPGLDASTKLHVAEIPIDGSTITLTTDGTKLQAPFVGGDMKRSVYDTNNDGICDHAALADNATNAATATNASGLTSVTGLGPLAEVWGRDASGAQGLFVTASGQPAIGSFVTTAFTWPAAGASILVHVNNAAPFNKLWQDWLVYVGPSYGVLQIVSSDTSANTVTLKNNAQYTANSGTVTSGSVPVGATIAILGVQVYDADPGNTITGGQTLVTDDTAVGTPLLPAIKRLKATDSSIVLDTTTSPLVIGIKAVTAAATAIHAYAYIFTANWTWATNTPIPFDQAYYNVGGMWASGSPTLLTVTTLGTYAITAQLTVVWGVAAGSTGVFRVALYYNGSLQEMVDCPSAGYGSGVNSGYQTVRLVSHVRTTATGSFDLRVLNVSGNTPTSILANQVQSFFKADYLGA